MAPAVTLPLGLPRLGRSTRSSRIATDCCAFVVVPPLFRHVLERGPGLRLELLQDPGRLPVEDLREGRIDVTLGSCREIPRDCMAVHLFTEDFARIVQRGHPHVRDRLSLETFTELGRVLVRPTRGPRRTDDSSAHRWFRDTVRELCAAA